MRLAELLFGLVRNTVIPMMTTQVSYLTTCCTSLTHILQGLQPVYRTRAMRRLYGCGTFHCSFCKTPARE